MVLGVVTKIGSFLEKGRGDGKGVDVGYRLGCVGRGLTVLGPDVE